MKEVRRVPERARVVDELVRLDAALRTMTQRMQLAALRRQFLDPGGGEDETQLVVEMDRIMTRIRATEAKLALIDREEKLPFE